MVRQAARFSTSRGIRTVARTVRGANPTWGTTEREGVVRRTRRRSPCGNASNNRDNLRTESIGK